VAEIVILSGENAGTVFVLPDIPTVVGRSLEAHVQITDPWISSLHAMFERRGDDIWVVDLDSRNGTFLGDERITEARVPSGTIVRFGRTEVRLDLGPARPGTSPREDTRSSREPHRSTVRADGTLSTRLPVPAPGPEVDPYALAPRPATVLRMAIDAAGIDGLPGAPGRLRGALDAATRAALEAGGVVTRLAGVGVLALFGLTGPSPDDAAQALSAARLARRAVRSQGGLDLRAAVDSGPVLAGNSSGTAGFELSALGPTAERAERLLAVAARGEILAGPGAASAAGLVRVGLVSLGRAEVEVFRADDEA
jgi:class 3 adenylate cyclase